jgi:hypothetical protein
MSVSERLTYIYSPPQVRAATVRKRTTTPNVVTINRSLTVAAHERNMILGNSRFQ